MVEQFNNLIELLSKNPANYDLEKIKKAYFFAKVAHSNQKRESGEDFITHPVAVATILADFELDTDSIIAALLHDVIEDTDATYKKIKKDFSVSVADLVEGVTKLGQIPYTSKEEQQMENLRKMFLAMAKDIRVILIKLADRLHNMRTLEPLEEGKRREKSLETMEVYAPLAHRLGMQRIKVELEDISLKYLDPVGYKTIEDNLKVKMQEREILLAEIKNRIINGINLSDIKYHFEGRIKQMYSIYRKMYHQNRDFDEIYDLYAIRIIVNNLIDCYSILGIIHDLYKPIPGRFKDFISTPKQNMYQSLHTTVIGKEGIPFEVQIRTWEMHRTAEYGIAAHWKYKTGIFAKDNQDEKLNWIRKLLEIQNDAKEPEDFMRNLKVNLFTDEVFVFTPKGDVVNLPSGSTPIDFAYSIHSAVGNRMLGAKVNGKIVELSYNLQNGEIVDILTSGASNGPSRDWLKIAKTSEARNKIRQWYKKEKREENILQGRDDLERELRRNGIMLNDSLREEVFAPTLKKLGLKNVIELYATIGYGGVTISKIITKIKEEHHRLTKHQEEEKDEIVENISTIKKPRLPKGIIVDGLDNCLIKLAGCCNPLPGDEIIGFVTRGFGVSVHKLDCLNVVNLGDEEVQRLIGVHWDITENEYFAANLNIITVNRIGAVADITTQLAAMRVMINNLNARQDKENNAVISLAINVKDLEHLKSIIARLEKIGGVISITRGNA